MVRLLLFDPDPHPSFCPVLSRSFPLPGILHHFYPGDPQRCIYLSAGDAERIFVLQEAEISRQLAVGISQLAVHRILLKAVKCL